MFMAYDTVQESSVIVLKIMHGWAAANYYTIINRKSDGTKASSVVPNAISLCLEKAHVMAN